MKHPDAPDIVVGIDAPSFHTETVAVPPVIYYVRHGLTDWNAEHRLQGRHDIPLNPEGCVQAVRCADILQDQFHRDGRAPESFDYVSSPLIRARKTMEIRARNARSSARRYSVDLRLAEIAFGEWEGLTYADVMARDEDVVARRESDNGLFRRPAAKAQVTARIGEWYARVDRDTVVAAHGGTARALVAHLKLAPPEDATVIPSTGVAYVFSAQRSPAMPDRPI